MPDQIAHHARNGAASSLLAVPDGRINPPPGPLSPETPSRVGGWALLASEPTAAIEVTANGRSLVRARVGLPRPDVARVTALAEAPTCGFEFWILPADVAPEAEQVLLEAEVRGTRGGNFTLPPVSVSVRRSPPASERGLAVGRTDRHLARLRERTVRAARQRSTRSGGHRTRRSDSLRVLAYSHRLERSGAPLYLFTLLRALQGDGVKCAVVSVEDGPLRRMFEALGIPVHVSYGTRFPGAMEYESKLEALIAWAAPQGFDIVHVNTIDAFLGVELARRLGIPAIWAIHESFTPDEWFAANNWTPEAYVRERMLGAFRTASAVLLATNSTRKQLLPCGAPERMVTMPYGIDLEVIDTYRAGFDRSATRKRLGIPDAATVVLSVATIEPRKGQTSLAKAFSIASKGHPEAVLVMVGETGLAWHEPYVSALRDFMARADLDARARILPVTQDPYQWVAACDVFVLASDIESLPLIVLEAMAFEVPMVATAISGIPGLVRDGHTGFLCRPSDVRDLSDALARVLALPSAELRRVGEVGAQEVRRKHDLRRYAARYRSMVGALTADPSALPGMALDQDQRTRVTTDADVRRA